MISSEEAFLLMRKWKTKKSPLRLLLAGPFGAGSFFGSIEDIEDKDVQFFGVDARSECLLRLHEATFEYGDAREAPTLTRAKAEVTYAGRLTAILPEGPRISFFELST
jgi:hypothetical protein